MIDENVLAEARADVVADPIGSLRGIADALAQALPHTAELMRVAIGQVVGDFAAVNEHRRALDRSRARHADLEQAIKWLRGRVEHLEKSGTCRVCGARFPGGVCGRCAHERRGP